MLILFFCILTSDMHTMLPYFSMILFDFISSSFHKLRLRASAKIDLCNTKKKLFHHEQQKT